MNTGAPNRWLSAYVIDNKHGLAKPCVLVYAGESVRRCRLFGYGLERLLRGMSQLDAAYVVDTPLNHIEIVQFGLLEAMVFPTLEISSDAVVRVEICCG